MIKFRTSYKSKLLISVTALTSLCAADVAMAQAKDEIIVTAQKREENLQDVPLAVSAISAEKIDQLGIDSAQDLSGLAPNVTIVGGTTSLGAAIVSIRGINSPAVETFGIDTANGIYIDGVYIARSAANGLDTLDLERVEVLRGPQSTLFGKNTTAGALNITTAKPTEDLSGYLTGAYEFNNGYTIDGAVSSALTDNLQGRVAIKAINKDDKKIGMFCTRYEVRCTVDNPVATIALCRAFHTAHV